MFINHQGKRKAKKIGNDKKKADQVAEKIKAKLVLGEMNIEKKKPRVLTFKEYAERWITVNAPAVTRSSTVWLLYLCS